MKKQGHPLYQDVLFVDSSTGDEFVIGSTLQPKERRVYNGKEYPLCRLPISSFSHPFFNKSKNQFIDAEGRVDRFTKRYAAKRQEQAASLVAQQEADEAAKKAKKKKK
ncbi:MAG: type B 50S ribosomal protein L31 [Simkania sp.]|nr:type B 50S ribosomal protein L31 [Simkania sp.]